MNTLGIWVENNKQKEKWEGKKHQEQVRNNNIDLTIHINLWKMQLHRQTKIEKITSFFKNDFDYFLDIGLKLPSIEKIKKLNVYFPFQITAEECIDLGGTFHEDTNLVNAIFNEDYRVISGSGLKILEVVRHDGSDKFNIYRLDTKNDIKLYQQYNGTVLEISFNQITQSRNESYYFRFRIKLKKEQNFTRVYKPRNSFFESAFMNTEIIDFRINEIRNLDKSLLEKMGKDGLPHLSKIHFLLLRNAKDDYVFSHKPINSCRELEKEIWKEYLKVNNRS